MKKPDTSKAIATVQAPAPVEILRPTTVLVNEAYSRFNIDAAGVVTVKDKNVTAREFAIVVCDQMQKSEHAGIAATYALRAASLVSDEMEKNVKAILEANLSPASYRNIVGNLSVLAFKLANPVFANAGLNTVKEVVGACKDKKGNALTDASGKLRAKLPAAATAIVEAAKAGTLTTAKVREIRKANPSTGNRRNASGTKKPAANPSVKGAELTAEVKALTLVTQWNAVKQTASLLDGETKAKIIAMITDIARTIGGVQVIVSGK